jgi:hypothetical protein
MHVDQTTFYFMDMRHTRACLYIPVTFTLDVETRHVYLFLAGLRCSKLGN